MYHYVSKYYAIYLFGGYTNLMDFTGERFVPGVDSGILEAEHVQRYIFAGEYAKGKSVLDIACGTGYGSSILNKAGATIVTGVDISNEAIEFAISTMEMIQLNL